MRKGSIKLVLLSIIILLLGIIAANMCLSRSYVNTARQGRHYRYGQYSQWPLKEYYDSLGYFPRSVEDAVDFVDIVNNYYNFVDSKEDIRARMMLGDMYSRKDGEIVYIPLYDYKTKIPTSFIFLSAGIDGKMDNQISPSDTLHTNTWWHDLDVYNYGEAILLKDFYEKWSENGALLSDSLFIKYYPPYPDLEPRFSMIKYLFGKKDWIIQIGLVE